MWTDRKVIGALIVLVVIGLAIVVIVPTGQVQKSTTKVEPPPAPTSPVTTGKGGK
jgi:hypothetical protein